MTELHVLRVFIGPDGRGGNPLGVFLDGRRDRARASARRWRRELGFSETVFVDDSTRRPASPRSASSRPAVELPFAGHPTVGTSWLLAASSGGRSRSSAAGRRRPRPGSDDDGRRWIRARAAWVHEFVERPARAAAEVDASAAGRWASRAATSGPGRTRPPGRPRSRYFATDVGILEDEATGCGRVVMGDRSAGR